MNNAQLQAAIDGRLPVTWTPIWKGTRLRPRFGIAISYSKTKACVEVDLAVFNDDDPTFRGNPATAGGLTRINHVMIRKRDLGFAGNRGSAQKSSTAPLQESARSA